MPNYPSFGQDYASSEGIINDTITEYGANNKIKVRSFNTTSTRTFTISHILTTAQKLTLGEFFQNNVSTPFSFTWAADGVTYTCIFTAPIQYNLIGPGFWNAQVSMLNTSFNA